MFRALRHRNFRLFVGGQIISLVGTWMQMVAQSWLIYRLTHSEWLLGATAFCLHLPVFLLGPLGGLAADRYSRHRLVILTQALSMLQATVLALLTLTGLVQVWHVLALALLLGTINAFDMPCRQSLVIQLTGKEDLLNAIALNSTIFNGARVLGPALAGVLVATLGEGICFSLNAVSFLAVIGGLLAMRLPRFEPPPPPSPWQHLIDGFRYAHRSRLLRVLLGLVAIVTISGMPALVLMPFFADAIFHRGSQGLGFLMGAMGTGAVVGTLVLARRPQATGLSGVIFTGRDAAHKYMKETFIGGPCPDTERAVYDVLQRGLAGGAIYHCGPVVRKVGPASGAPRVGQASGLPRIGQGSLLQPKQAGQAAGAPGVGQASGLPGAGPASAPSDRYEFVAAGPTTSIREEPYQADVIRHFGLRAVIGKGGMGPRTLAACQECGAVYLHAIGGAATLIADSVKEVLAVHKLEFGVPEALWEIRVVDFPCVVTMDSHGASLHAQVEADSRRKLAELLR